MPIYILTEQMSEKIKCPERDSNPRHPDLMEGEVIPSLKRPGSKCLVINVSFVANIRLTPLWLPR